MGQEWVRRNPADKIEDDRASTDFSLRKERRRSDDAIGETIEERTEAKLEQTRERTEDRLKRTMPDEADEAAATADLPEVAQSLVDAAHNLSQAAEGLTRIADTLQDVSDPEAAATLRNVTVALGNAAGTVSSGLGGTALSAPPADGEPEVAGKLAEVAENLSVVALELAEERMQADDTLREERARIDETLRQEREVVDEALEEERVARQRLLDAERRETDRDLARERSDTDAALDQTFSLLKAEEAAHHEAREVAVTREEFLAIVSHDLRTPLSIIAVNTSMIKEMIAADSRSPLIADAIERMERATSRMGRMISDLLDATRFERGRFRLTPEDGDGAAMVRECATAFDELARLNGISLEVDVPGHPVRVPFDHDRILQVLSNLVRNSLQHTAHGQTITLRLTAEGRGCLIEVHDTGSGIPKADQHRVFDRFHQAENSDAAGLGLGLYIAKAIVEAHGGRIWVESIPGDGTSVFFTLPG
jgi:signal transduction histidine kinase